MIAVLCSVLCFFAPLHPEAKACGVNAHTWISDSALCQLPIGSELQRLMSDQELVELVRIGASFPDSGYPIEHPYAERAHWSPFMERCVRRFQERYPPSEPLSEEGLREAAFLLGVASHGLEDELFDTQFLRWTVQEDGVDQDQIDSAVDFFLIGDGHSELSPQVDPPLTVVIEALREAGVEVGEEDIHSGYRFIKAALSLSQRPMAAQLLAERKRPEMPWSATHYLDPEVTGSLAHEPRIISRQLELNWARLRAQFEPDQALIAITPELDAGERLDIQAVAARSEAGWISLYFGLGVEVLSLRERLSLLNEAGEPIPFEWRATRWGGGEGLTRLFQLMPSEALAPDQRLSLRVEPGVALVGGAVSAEPWLRLIQSSCAEPCEPLEQPERAYGGRVRGCWVTELEVGTEAGIEAGVEAGVEARAEAGAEAGTESGAESGTESGTESDTEGGAEAGVSAASQAGLSADQALHETATRGSSGQGCAQGSGGSSPVYAALWLALSYALSRRRKAEIARL